MIRRSRARFLHLLGVLSLLAIVPVTSAPPAAANHTVNLTVGITRIADLGGDLDDGAADLYVAVVIDGQVFTSFNNIAVDVDTRQLIGVSFTKRVELVRNDNRPALIPVTMSVWDNDTCGEPFCDDQIPPSDNDDKGDTKNGPGDEVTIFVDPIAGTWSGDVTSPTQCSNGGISSDSAEVCWTIGTDAADSDGDGLLDDWELNGLDLDNTFPPEIPLDQMGADPNRQDIFLELDYTAGQTPTRKDIRAMVRAFDAAGINLHVDLGDLIDPTAIEGQPEGTCMDGIDNGGDGQTDGADTNCDNVAGRRNYLETSTEDPNPAAGNCGDGIDNDGVNGADASDPSCRVSDFFDLAPFGGGPILDNSGNPAPALANCGLDATFYAAKNGGPGFSANFNPGRRWVFHYAISTAGDPDTDGAGPDTACGIGGQGEIGGNDFIEYNHDGGTIMHELGHNLKLQHGGADSNNCKPNYVSGMNYDHQFGIPRVGGGAILDYAPPRTTVNGATRGVAPLPQLTENSLDETVILDTTDGSNRFIFSRVNPVSGVVEKIVNNLNQRANWNGDSDAAGNPDTTDTNVSMNIDNAGVPPGSPAGTTPSPPACANGAIGTTPMSGQDDWHALSLPFLQYGDSLTTNINAEQDRVPTLEDRDVLLNAINSADVWVTLADSPDPVGAGERLTYTLTAGNKGPNPASSVEVRTTLPAGVVFVDVSVPCVRSSAVVTCNLGELLPGASRSFTIRVDIPANFLYPGASTTITTGAAVDNLAGPDPDTSNDNASAATLVITKADVQITSLTTTTPLDVLIGQPVDASFAVSVANGGPSSPVDTVLTGTMTTTPGLIIAPANTSASQTALAIGTPRTVTQTFTLTCTTPGVKTVTVAYALALADPHGVDPDTTNNTRATTFSVDCVVPVKINVRPGGFPNSINLNTDATLAVLTTRAGEYGLPLAFDARTIQPLTVRWGLRSNLFNVATASGAREIHKAVHLERSYEPDDKTRDADVDGVMHFKPSDSGLTLSSTEACVKGKFTATDGNVYTFFGCDTVRVVN